MGIASANEWSQIEEGTLQMPDHYNTTSSCGGGGGGSGGGGRVMERSGQGLDQNNQPVLKCPRCDSSNTKFCYYNNYSLSQPRHFCKACKRYWTRGGTLRNVPVGGGCRKNKRVKKPSPATSDPQLPPHPIHPPHSLPNPSQIDVSGSVCDLNPLFYGVSNASSGVNLSFPVPFRSRMEQQTINPMPCTAYDLQPQMNALGLSYSHNPQHDQDYPSGFKNHLTELQQPSPASAEAINSGSSFLQDSNFFGSSLSSAAAASLLASSLKQPKMGSSRFLPFEDLQSSGNWNLGLFREIKVEDHRVNMVMNHEKLEWQLPCDNNPLETVGADFSHYWNAAGGSWPDAAANCGSSVAPLL